VSLIFRCIFRDLKIDPRFSPTVKRALLAGGFGRDIDSSQLPIEIATVVPPNPVHETLTPHRPAQSRTNSHNVDGIAELPSDNKAKSEDSSSFDIEKGDDLATVEHQATWQKAASIDGGTFGELSFVFFDAFQEPLLMRFLSFSIVDVEFPCFHIDLATAVAAAARKRD
jgi:hypothetical protein